MTRKLGTSLPARKIRKPERVGLRIFMTGKPASSGKENTTLNDTEFSQFLKVYKILAGQ